MHPHDLPPSVATLVRSGSLDAAVALIEQHWERLATRHQPELLLALQELPAAALLRNPHLAVMAPRPAACVAGASAAVERPVRPSQSADPAALLGRLSRLTHRSQVAREAGDPLTAGRLAREARDALESSDAAATDVVADALPVLLWEWARSLDAAGFAEACLDYERAYEIARSVGIPVIASRAAAGAAWLHAEIGRTAQARLWIERARTADDAAPHAAACLAEAVLLIDRNAHAEAAVLLGRAEEAGVADHWPAALWVRSLLAHDLASAAVTESMIEGRVRRHPGVLDAPGFAGRLVRAARARALVLRGRIDRDLDTHLDLSLSDQVVAAALHLFRGEHQEAFDLSRPITEEPSEPRLQSNALLVHAAAALALRRMQTAVSAFQRADAVIQHHGLHVNYETIAHADLERLIALAGAEEKEALRVHSARRDDPGLSRRENDVLSMLVTELSMDEIAERMFVTRNTLKTLTRRLYRKLGVTTRAGAVDYAQSRPEFSPSRASRHD